MWNWVVHGLLNDLGIDKGRGYNVGVLVLIFKK
jgi:hypothetical protein